MARARIALLSNPKSTGNVAQLPRVRAYCAEHPDIFHYEVERVEQIGEALKTIARVKPAMLVINGGDGTVQAALTDLHNGGHFRPPLQSCRAARPTSSRSISARMAIRSRRSSGWSNWRRATLARTLSRAN